MVVGRSGSGKSSLVYAGLFPALRRDREQFWNVLTLRPGPSPLRSLAAAFNPRTDDQGAAEYQTKITKEADELRTADPELLSNMIRQELDQAEGKPDRLLLYVDQWEELYAQAPLGSDRKRAAEHDGDVNRFIDLLLTAAQTAPVNIVATVRADFYDPLIGHEGIKSLLPNHQVLLGKMSRSELQQTIVEPARIVGLVVAPELVQRILDDVGEDEGMLPLLEYALKETWNRREGNCLTDNSYSLSGGVRKAIQLTAERAFESLSADDQRAARQLFLRLVTPGEGKEDTRARAVMPAELQQRKIVEQFAGSRTRLLVTGSDRAGRPIIEVAHEALIRTWPRLREWIDANREKLRARAAVLQAKAEWEEQGQREDLLLPSGFQLERARALIKDPGDITIDDIQKFVELSFKREECERKEREQDQARAARRRMTNWALGAVGAVVLAAGATIGLLQYRALTQTTEQMNKANSALASAEKWKKNAYAAEFRGILNASDTALKAGKHDQARALALASRELISPSEQTTNNRSAYSNSLVATLRDDVQELYPRHGEKVEGPIFGAYSADGKVIVWTSDSGTVNFTNSVSGTMISRFPRTDGELRSLTISRDGNFAALLVQDGKIEVYSRAAGAIAELNNTLASLSADAVTFAGSAEQSLLVAVVGGRLSAWRLASEAARSTPLSVDIEKASAQVLAQGKAKEEKGDHTAALHCIENRCGYFDGSKLRLCEVSDGIHCNLSIDVIAAADGAEETQGEEDKSQENKSQENKGEETDPSNEQQKLTIQVLAPGDVIVIRNKGEWRSYKLVDDTLVLASEITLDNNYGPVLQSAQHHTFFTSTKSDDQVSVLSINIPNLSSSDAVSSDEVSERLLGVVRTGELIAIAPDGSSALMFAKGDNLDGMLKIEHFDLVHSDHCDNECGTFFSPNSDAAFMANENTVLRYNFVRQRFGSVVDNLTERIRSQLEALISSSTGFRSGTTESSSELGAGDAANFGTRSAGGIKYFSEGNGN
jgi:hypothetical protein